MEQYVGLDVSLKETSLCVVDQTGTTLWQGKCASTPESIAAVLARRAPGATRIGLESGLLSTWHWHALKALGLPVVCLDARHAKAALSLRLNKTDANDAEGLAQIVRTGWYRQVQVKSLDSHLIRTLLAARAGLVAMHRDVANQIRGALKTFGLVLGKVAAGAFEARVRQLIAGNPLLVEVIEALLKVWRTTGEQLVTLHRRVLRLAQTDETCRRLMTVPGVGAVTAAAFMATVDDPERFRLSGLPASPDADRAVDDPLAQIIAKIVVVAGPAIEEPFVGDVVVHADLGADERAVLDALAADVAEMRTDERMPGTQIPLTGEASYPSASPTVVLAGADGVEMLPLPQKSTRSASANTRS